MGFGDAGSEEETALGLVVCPFKCKSCGGKKMCKAVKPRKFMMDDSVCIGDFKDCGLYRVRMGMDNE